MKTINVQTLRYRSCLFFVFCFFLVLSTTFAQSNPLFDSNGSTLPGTLLLPMNGQQVLSAVPLGGQSANYQWMLDGTAIRGATSGTFISSNTVGAGDYSCEVTLQGNRRNRSSVLNAGPVSIAFASTISCGDMNADGVKDLRDLFPLSVAYEAKGPARSTQILNPGNAANVPSLDWPITPQLGAILPPQLPNPKHFDSNGDGFLLEDDVDCLAAQYEPLYQSSTLLAQSFSGAGTSRGSTLKMRAEAPMSKVRVLSDGRRVEVTIDLVIDQLPAREPFVKMKGLILTDAITETPNYTVDNVRLDFSGSDLFDDPTDALALGKSFAGVRTAPGTCARGSAFLTEIGAFNKYETKVLYPGDAPISCIVTVDDLFKVHNSNNLGLNEVAIVLQTFNTLTYVEKNGLTSALGGDCQLDTVWLDIDSLYQVALAGGSTNKTGNADPSSVPVDPGSVITSATIAPQPVKAGEHTRLRLQNQDAGLAQAEIYSLEGRLLWTEAFQATPGEQWLTIHHPELTPGAYVLRLQAEKGIVFRKQLVVTQ